MKLLLEVYTEYKKNKIVECINKKLNFTDEPETRLKLLSVKNKIFKLKVPDIARIRYYEDKALSIQ